MQKEYDQNQSRRLLGKYVLNILLENNSYMFRLIGQERSTIRKWVKEPYRAIVSLKYRCPPIDVPTMEFMHYVCMKSINSVTHISSLLQDI